MSDQQPAEDEITEDLEADDTEGNLALHSQPPREGDDGGTEKTSYM